MKWYHNQFEFRKDKGITWIHFANCIEFARLVASMNNAERFNDIFDSVNPIINNCLRYALKHLEKYKHRAIDILKFGINHNRRIANEIVFNDYYVCDELGGLKSCRDEDCYDIVIFVDVEVNDDEIRPLINQLLEFNKLR